jgi:hypothetical protein
MSENNTTLDAAILGLLVAAGLATAGYFVSNTVYKGKLASNTVTVKGFSERDVRADLALWTISYSITGGNLTDLYAQSSKNGNAIVDFLGKEGFKKGEIKFGDVQITDLLANQFRQNNVAEDKRYILKSTIAVRSNDVALVDQATHALNDLIRQGIVLTSNEVDFEFTRLNEIKAPMLRAATQNARGAAQQFANDAGSRVGSIQTANQGFFSVGSRDSPTAQNQDGEENGGSGAQNTIDKKVRVVVTLTYYLEK